MLRRRSSSSSAKSSTKRRSSSAGFDEFGFAFIKRREKKLHHRSHDYSFPQPNALKVKELCELLSYWNGSSFICRNQIERFIRIGIPTAVRGRVWKCLLDLDNVRVASDFSYQVCLTEIRKGLVDLGVSEYSIVSAITTLIDKENDLGSGAGQTPDAHSSAFSTVDVALFRQIALDLQRSFPTHRSLMGDSPEAIEGQAKLFRVLTAYAKFNPQIGYCQGMSYIAAVFLMLLGEEEAFWALVVLLEKPKYLSELFDSSLKKIQHQALVFQQLLKHRKPQLFQHLEKLGVSSFHFVMQWFLTLFTSLPCWDSVLAIWDLFLLHGLLAVFRAGLTILHLLEPRLMSMTEETTVLPLLLRVPVDVSQYSVLIPALWSTEVQEWEINCMNSVILEEMTESHETEKTKEDSSSSVSSDEQKEKSPAVENPAEDRPSKKEPVGPGGKNLFARILKLAQRYLADSAKQNTSNKAQPASPARSSPVVACQSKKRTSVSFTQAQRRRSQSRRPQNEAVVRKEPLPPQCTDGGTAENRSQVPLRRLKSGPVGRVARRRSGVQSGGGKSLLLRSSNQSQKASIPTSPVSQDPNQACTEPRESPGKSSIRPPLEEGSVFSPRTGTEVRESQLI
ncbi:TBC1 domain family member 10B-like [Astyanax mexicanus]|uniref:TBC1 domain family member 10B-like n=1 Tax=Astyanax mexicanus TaxID=7994 RepID=A0A8T2LT32_ASTMX|nr:TBC1 domain family member 10B-like [Astyanax mexicanus]